MNAVFRVDATSRVGTGHLMRCLTLASLLRREGATCTFLSRLDNPALAELITGRDFTLRSLSSNGPPLGVMASGENLPAHSAWLDVSWEEDVRRTTAAMDQVAEWVIVDSYALDWRWESAMRAMARNVMVIDDLADRDHDCEVLLDQNLWPAAETRYSARTPLLCRTFIGPEFALLRDEIRLAGGAAPPVSSRFSVMVFFGGADLSGITLRATHAAIACSDLPVDFDIVVGALSDREEVARAAASLPNVRIHSFVEDFGALMARSHFAIGAVGATTLERLFYGLPAAVVVCAENQRDAAFYLQELGLVRLLGDAERTDAAAIAAAIREMITVPEQLQRMRYRAESLAVGTRTGELVSYLRTREC